MKRPWQVWLVFVACVAGAAMAMLWLTRQALDADRMRRVAEADAELEQRVSLALWRMDTELAPIVAEEVVRPPSAYRTNFLATQSSGPPSPAQQQATQQWAEPAEQQTVNPAAIAVEPPLYVLMQCEARPDGTWHSPQVPALQNGTSSHGGLSSDAVQQRAAQLADLASAVTLPELLEELPDTPLPTAEMAGSNFLAQNSARTLDELAQLEKQIKFFESNRSIPPAKQSPSVDEHDSPVSKGAPSPSGKAKQIATAADFEQRVQRYQTSAQQNLFNRRQQEVAPTSAPVNYGVNEGLFGTPDAYVGVSRPLWIGERLLLARRVTWNGETFVQGCWLDWPKIKTRLLAEAVDLLPEADLAPVKDDAAADPGRMLAGLPVRLIVGEAAVVGAVGPALRTALWMGWGAVLLATAAAAALLHGVMTLSERRAAFVSSVTHELRTPLTTFRMYAEMLARGMVPDAQRRQEYFHTLEREAERLTLLVENVLAYARLERGRKPQAIECVTLKTLLDRIEPRLAHRAAQAGMQCEVHISPDAADVEFTTDLNVAEQILFNLVDNSAKYAREAADRRIHVDASRDGTWMKIAVRDHGPGISHARSSRTMRAFGKSAQESADTAPGVGLGLALCRRLARQLRGRLEIDRNAERGATVVLSLRTTDDGSKSHQPQRNG
jgi:signal transduction histidine kinase